MCELRPIPCMNFERAFVKARWWFEAPRVNVVLFPQKGNFTPHSLSLPRCINGYRWKKKKKMPGVHAMDCSLTSQPGNKEILRGVVSYNSNQVKFPPCGISQLFYIFLISAMTKHHRNVQLQSCFQSSLSGRLSLPIQCNLKSSCFT